MAEDNFYKVTPEETRRVEQRFRDKARRDYIAQIIGAWMDGFCLGLRESGIEDEETIARLADKEKRKFQAKFQVICKMQAQGFADELMSQVTELSLDMVQDLKELCIQENEKY